MGTATLAVLSPVVQLQAGYFDFLVQHLYQAVGFVCVQRRIWNHAAMTASDRRCTSSTESVPGEDEPVRYAHVSWNDTIPPKQLLFGQ